MTAIEQTMNGSAVLDLGTARFKLAVATPSNDGLSFDHYKEEVGLGGMLGARGHLDDNSISIAIASCERLMAICKERSCKWNVAIATEAFRVAKNSDEVRAALEPIVGKISVLDSQMEGLLYSEGVKMQLGAFGFPSESPLVLDIGGGSVQLTWSEEAVGTVSIPTGTYKLETMFQPHKEVDLGVLASMREHITSLMRSAVPQGLERGTVVLGSTCMADFISSALSAAKQPFLRRVLANQAQLTECSPAAVEALYKEISGKEYDALGDFYPANPFFMYGADKALLNAIVAQSLFNSKVVLATNESLARSLARLLVTSPNQVSQKYGISIHDVF